MLPIEYLYIGITSLVSLCCGAALFATYRHNQKLQQNILDLQKSPAWATEENIATLEGAKKQAEQIMTTAELEAIKLEASGDLTGKLFRQQLAQFEVAYQQKFDQNMQQLQKDFGAYLAKSETDYQHFLAGLEQQSGTLSSQIQESIKGQINKVLFDFEQNLSTFLATSQQKSLEAVNLEVKSARSLIDSYKQQQFQIVDENIVAVLERTLAIVLRNKLTLKDQMDLVFEALEKAKAEKFFA